MAGNKTFARAIRAKNDEFYTQLADIESELRHYREQFRGKVVLCNCDDPYESNFFKYFAMNFHHLGLKRLITTSYSGSPITGEQLPLFSVDGMSRDVVEKSAYRVELTEVPDANNDGAIDLYDVECLLKNERNVLTLLAGSGDFGSAECIALLEEADIVVTNPPFSLFRKYVGQLVEHDKKFLILGNQNAIAYGEIFRLIKEDRLWLGYDNGGEKWFRVPDSYNHTTDRSKIRVDGGVRYLAMKNMAWFTNLDTTKRHEVMTLYKRYTPDEYPTYTNYPAIEVAKVSDIPMDYNGAIGVPINNGLDVHVAWENLTAAQEVVHAAERAIGVSIRILGSDPLKELGCTGREYCTDPMKAGNVVRKGSTTGTQCTMAFHVRIGSNEQFLMAGHCGWSGSIYWYHKGWGLVGSEQANGLTASGSPKFDIMRVEMPDSQASPKIYGDNIQIVGWQWPLVGQAVTVSAGVSNRVITNWVVDDYITYTNGSCGCTAKGTKTTQTSGGQGGDSGSPTYAKDPPSLNAYAVGLGVVGASGYDIVARIGDAMQKWGLGLVT